MAKIEFPLLFEACSTFQLENASARLGFQPTLERPVPAVLSRSFFGLAPFYHFVIAILIFVLIVPRVCSEHSTPVLVEGGCALDRFSGDVPEAYVGSHARLSSSTATLRCLRSLCGLAQENPDAPAVAVPAIRTRLVRLGGRSLRHLAEWI